jgi:Domain of unknown function (DUF4124)
MNSLVATAVALALAAAFAASPASAGQSLYRWVDHNGNVEWRDTPPPATAKHVEQRKLGGNLIETSSPSFALQQAIKSHPVTLWTFDCGEPCSKAAAHLARRGIPYVAKNSQKEPEALQKATGGLEVPVLLVGSQQYKGYLEGDWDAALDSAGYPRKALTGARK